jgi:septum formation topological specificity factor MinE
MDTKEENKEPAPIPVLVPNTKEELIANIKEWIKIDNDIAKLKAEIKDRTNKKKMLTTNLVTVMKTNSIDCFDINDGALVYKQTKSKKSITGKTLLAALQNYYKEQPNLAEDLTKHVLDSREEVVKETIKRKIDK